MKRLREGDEQPFSLDTLKHATRFLVDSNISASMWFCKKTMQIVDIATSPVVFIVPSGFENIAQILVPLPPVSKLLNFV